MKIKYEIRYGCACCGNWKCTTVISTKHTFIEALEENGINVVIWEYSAKLPTFVEIDSDNLPTGKVFQLINWRFI